jgi:predicted nucleic acid-binding protein
MIVVADASPLRYLVLIAEVEILPGLYGRLLTPPAVVKELSHPRTPEVVRRWIAAPPDWLHIRAPLGPLPEFPATLGVGEREAIALAEETRAEVLLVDDGAGRREAKRRRLATRGTLGILGLAARHGLTDLQTAISGLRATNFRASDEQGCREEQELNPSLQAPRFPDSRGAAGVRKSADAANTSVAPRPPAWFR